MAVLPLTKIPDPFLLAVSLPVETIDDDIRVFAQDMLDTMYNSGGVGIAAVQVGKLLRITAIDVNYRDGERKPLIAINPEIVASSEEQSSYDEGCLSVGPYRSFVSRPARITVSYTDLEGEKHQIEADGILATCFQHEIDHMDGVLFFDHLTKEQRQEILDQVAAEQTSVAGCLWKMQVGAFPMLVRDQDKEKARHLAGFLMFSRRDGKLSCFPTSSLLQQEYRRAKRLSRTNRTEQRLLFLQRFRAP